MLDLVHFLAVQQMTLDAAKMALESVPSERLVLQQGLVISL